MPNPIGPAAPCVAQPHLALACSAPYWFHLVRYTARMHAVAALMAASYTTGEGWCEGWLAELPRPICWVLHCVCEQGPALWERSLADNTNTHSYASRLTAPFPLPRSCPLLQPRLAAAGGGVCVAAGRAGGGLLPGHDEPLQVLPSCMAVPQLPGSSLLLVAL